MYSTVWEEIGDGLLNRILFGRRYGMDSIDTANMCIIYEV